MGNEIEADSFRWSNLPSIVVERHEQVGSEDISLLLNLAEF
jgi:hypothetical protein